MAATHMTRQTHQCLSMVVTCVMLGGLEAMMSVQVGAQD